MRTNSHQRYDWFGRMERLEDRLLLSADPIVGSLTSQFEQTLADAHDQTGLSHVQTAYGFDGSGQTVAVIDSGIAYDHFALGGGLGPNFRVVGGWDFTGENDADPYDDLIAGGHGTHVAGIVGAKDGSNSGVAPGVDLVGLRVFDDAGNGDFAWVEEALQWVLDNINSFENPITTVNLSLGEASWNSDTLPTWANLEDEFDLLKQAGIFISVSAGESFTNFNETGLSYPAASPHVVPVASIDDNGLFSFFSQRNSSVIAAPGRGIISTVPDFFGNNDGTPDDYAGFSGTSTASPYVAGASAIVREAMEFVGYTNITQDTIYDHIVATADTFFDSATNQSYSRLNMEAAIDALIPEDEYGSTVATAHNLGTLSVDTLVSGALMTLDDIDYFKFTSAVTGTVTLTAATMTHGIDAAWSVSGGIGTNSGANNEIFSIDVVAGQAYTVGFSSNDGIGYYDLDIVAESTASFTDLGSISFRELQGVSIDGTSWYRVEADSAGFFSSEALFQAAGGPISLELYNSELQLIVAGDAAGGVSRVDTYVTANEELYLKAIGTNDDVDIRLTNMVSLDGSTVNIAGTANDDTFAFVAGSTHQTTVNGTTYYFPASVVLTFQFDGAAGTDSILLTGSAAEESAHLRVGDTQFSGSTYAAEALQIEMVTVDGGGGTDTAYLFDSAGDDTLVADPESAQMTGTGFDHLASGFELTYSYATVGGSDRATLKDSAGDDTYVGRPEYARLSGEGFYNYTQGFELAYVYSNAGGSDTAELYDSVGDDTFVGRPEYARISGPEFYNYTQGFGEVNAYAAAGGDDLANLYDSEGDDIFTARPEYGRLQGEGFNNYANGFDSVYAYATTGGTDQAYLYDSTGDDIFTTRPEYGRMSGLGFFNQANNFDRVNAYATGGGDDDAYFYDSEGDDDFVARPDYGRMNGADFSHYAKDFERVYAYATLGGNDQATLYGSDSGNDNLVSGPTAYLLSSDAFYSYASQFETLVALTYDGDPLAVTSAVDSAFEEAGA